MSAAANPQSEVNMSEQKIQMIYREYPHTNEYHSADCASKKARLEVEQRMEMTVGQIEKMRADLKAAHKAAGIRKADEITRIHGCVTKAIAKAVA